jgi:hypothetical protein
LIRFRWNTIGRAISQTAGQVNGNFFTIFYFVRDFASEKSAQSNPIYVNYAEKKS